MGVKSLIRFIKRNDVFYKFFLKINERFVKLKSRHYTTVNHKGTGKIKREILGSYNYIEVGKGSRLYKLKILIYGDNNKIKIGKNCIFREGCSLWICGNNNEINVGDGSTFMYNVHINASENNTKITIGKDCMFANTIIVRTSDDHLIEDLNTGERLNPPKNVCIGNHVWVTPNVKIMKGAYIADGCVVGSDTTVSKEFRQKNCLIVGRPTKIVKENIKWYRHLTHE